MVKLQIYTADYASQRLLRPKSSSGLNSSRVFTLSRVFCYSSVAIILAAAGLIKPISSIRGNWRRKRLEEETLTCCVISEHRSQIWDLNKKNSNIKYMIGMTKLCLSPKYLVKAGVMLWSSQGSSSEMISLSVSCWTWTQIWIAFQRYCHAARVTLAHLNLLQITLGLL